MKKTLFLSLAIILLLSGCGLTNKNKQAEEKNILSPKEAKTKAEEFINNNLVVQSDQEAKIANVSEENQLYKFDVQIQGQTIQSYMTKDGKMFFPQARNMENPQKGTAANNANASPDSAQQMSIEEKSQAVVSQTKSLLTQAGDSIDQDTKKEIEEKVKELEELNNSEDSKEKDLTNKITEIQKLVQPIIQEMTSSSEEQTSGSVEVNSAE